MTLHLHRAERADRLVEALGDLLLDPLPDPMAPEIVSVPTRGVERWITQQLSNVLGTGVGRADGVCANVEFPFPGRLIGAALADSTDHDPDGDVWRPERLVWPLLEVVDESLDEPWLVVYTAGQFGDDAANVLRRLAAAGARVVAITDADVGGVRIARRVRQACPDAEIIDVGEWPHPERPRYPADSAAVTELQRLAHDPLVGEFAAAVLARGYPVEQELATLDIVRSRAIEGDHRRRRAR